MTSFGIPFTKFSRNRYVQQISTRARIAFRHIFIHLEYPANPKTGYKNGPSDTDFCSQDKLTWYPKSQLNHGRCTRMLSLLYDYTSKSIHRPKCVYLKERGQMFFVLVFLLRVIFKQNAENALALITACLVDEQFSMNRHALIAHEYF